MHVSKSVLASIALLLLFLVAALAFMPGRETQIEPATRVSSEKSESPNSNLQPKADAASKIEVAADVRPSSRVLPQNEFSASEQRLIDNWAEANEMCRGSSDQETIELWCPRRDQAFEAMNRAGICYGHKDDQSAAEADIHRCREGSLP